jgi:hypothetical protein
MTARRPKTRWYPSRRRLLSGLWLLAYLAGTLGFPVSSPIQGGKDRSQPFPCQDRPCGCRSAEECWRSCCCTTPEERLAWAREHHVAPPAYAVLPCGGWNDRRQFAGQDDCSACSGCRDSVGGANGKQHVCELCARQQSAVPHKACCSQAGKPPSGQTPRARGTERTMWVLGVLALRCRGLGTDWLACGIALPPPARLVWQPSLPPLGWVRSQPPNADSISTAPLHRPPRGRLV